MRSSSIAALRSFRGPEERSQRLSLAYGGVYSRNSGVLVEDGKEGRASSPSCSILY